MAPKQANKPSSGVVYSASSAKELPKDLLTWHDLLPYRIWIHSRKSDSGFKPISVDVQWVGKESPLVSDMEKKLRINLATVLVGDGEDSQLGPTSFRNLALGRFLEEHARLIAGQKNLQRVRGNRAVNLVRDFEFQDFPGVGVEVKAFRGGARKGLDLRANKRDSLFIAYIYAEQCSNGSKMPASLTADILGIDKSLVYVAVRSARKYGWLSKSRSGSAQGKLTEQGAKEMRSGEYKGIYEQYLKSLGV